jgi:alpha/beta superfamily hydrolase
MRFFFDYVTQSQVIYDYAGAEFANAEHALDFAEATRQDLKNSANGEWIGWSVKVRDAECKTFFSLAVEPNLQVSVGEKAAA